MKLDTLIGNQELKSSLVTALESGSLAHAVLLTGADGCGRGYVSRCLAADYLFPQGGPQAEAVMQLQSSELLLVEGEGRSGQIPVERIRSVRQEIFHSALSSSGRVVLIKDAHRMAAPSANALLKVLEEPPAGALFVLSARDAASLPQTIVSRCALYPLAPVSFEECELELARHLPLDASPALPAMLSRLYGGKIGTGLRILQQEGRLTVLQDALEAAAAAGKASSYGMLRVFARYEGRGDGDRELREALLADMAEIFGAGLREIHADGLVAVSPAQAAAFLPHISQTRLALRGNMASKIAFSTLAVQLSRAGRAVYAQTIRN